MANGDHIGFVDLQADVFSSVNSRFFFNPTNFSLVENTFMATSLLF